MARDHAVIRLDMWGDDDWRTLSVPAQHLYMLLLTSPTLSFCGVADWRPARVAPLAGDWSVAEVVAAADELRAGLFLVIDEETEEVLIRSFVRHDGLMKMPNMATAMATAHAAIASSLLRGVVVHELKRLHEQEPDLPGWKSKRALTVLDKASIDPSANPSVMGSAMGSDDPSRNPSPTPAPTPAPTPKETTLLSDDSDVSDLFAEFWKHYPRKDSKQDAMKAWKQVIKSVKPAVIVEAVQAYPFKPERNFQPLPGSWLRGRRWEDEAVQLPLESNGQLTSTDVQNILGPDHWTLPRPPLGLSDADEYAWEQKIRREHLAERQQQARARMGRTA